MAEPFEAWAGDAVIYKETVDAFLQGRVDPNLWVWTPGYAVVATPFAALFGSSAALLVVSFLASVSIPILTYGIGVAIGNPALGAIAGSLLAMSPELALAGSRPLSDALGPALLVVAAYLLVRDRPARRKPRASPSLYNVMVAGFAGGLAALTRPESLLAVPILPFVVHGLRPRRDHFAFLVAAGLVLSPYVLGLHQASGVWGLSLKPAMNLYKSAVYERAGAYYQGRAAWGAAVKAMSDDDGEFDPRKLVAAAAPYSNRAASTTLAEWGGHLKMAIRQTRTETSLLAVLGAIGLLLPGEVRGRVLFVTLSLPFLAVPLFVNPLGRFLLPALPGHAWGLARVLSVAPRLLRRGPARVQAGLLGAGLLLIAGRGIHRADTEARETTFHARLVEIEAAISSKEIDNAERLLGFARRRRPRDPAALQLQGKIHDARGRLDEAEKSFREAMENGATPLGFAEFLLRNGRTEEAETVLSAVADSPPEGGDFWKLYGHVAFRLGKYDRALVGLQKAEDISGRSAQSDYNVGLVLYSLGRVAEAKERLTRAARSGDPAVNAVALEVLQGLTKTPPASAPHDTSNLTP